MKKDQEVMRTVKLPERLWRRLVTLTDLKGMKLQSGVAFAVERYLKEEERGR